MQRDVDTRRWERAGLAALVCTALFACGPSEEELRAQAWQRVATQVGPKIEALREADVAMARVSEAAASARGEGSASAGAFERLARVRHACMSSRERIADIPGAAAGIEQPEVATTVGLLVSAARSHETDMVLHCATDHRGLLRTSFECDRACIQSWAQLRRASALVSTAASLDGVRVPRLGTE